MHELALGSILGHGAFGSVYEAQWDTGDASRRDVAVKLLHRHRLDEAGLAQFKR